MTAPLGDVMGSFGIAWSYRSLCRVNSNNLILEPYKIKFTHSCASSQKLTRANYIFDIISAVEIFNRHLPDPPLFHSGRWKGAVTISLICRNLYIYILWLLFELLSFDFVIS